MNQPPRPVPLLPALLAYHAAGIVPVGRAAALLPALLALHAAGIGPIGHAATLLALAAGPVGMTVLSDVLGCTTAGVTFVADQLEGLGLVSRVRVAGDRRRVALELTTKGRSLVDGLEATP